MEKDDFAFCFKKAKGLKLISPNENLVEVYKRKSKSALNMLTSAIEKQESEWILETSYYARYFIVYALFMKVGIKSEIHDCTTFALNSIFAASGIISQELCNDLSDSRDLRVQSLYYDKEFGMEKIMNKAKSAPDFCLKTESIIDRINAEDVSNIRKRFEERMKSVF